MSMDAGWPAGSAHAGAASGLLSARPVFDGEFVQYTRPKPRRMKGLQGARSFMHLYPYRTAARANPVPPATPEQQQRHVCRLTIGLLQAYCRLTVGLL